MCHGIKHVDICRTPHYLWPMEHVTNMLFVAQFLRCFSESEAWLQWIEGGVSEAQGLVLRRREGSVLTQRVSTSHFCYHSGCIVVGGRGVAGGA